MTNLWLTTNIRNRKSIQILTYEKFMANLRDTVDFFVNWTMVKIRPCHSHWWSRLPVTGEQLVYRNTFSRCFGDFLSAHAHKSGYLCFGSINFHAKNHQNWYKFDNVLRNTNLLFFETQCIRLFLLHMGGNGYLKTSGQNPILTFSSATSISFNRE